MFQCSCTIPTAGGVRCGVSPLPTGIPSCASTLESQPCPLLLCNSRGEGLDGRLIGYAIDVMSFNILFTLSLAH